MGIFSKQAEPGARLETLLVGLAHAYEQQALAFELQRAEQERSIEILSVVARHLDEVTAYLRTVIERERHDRDALRPMIIMGGSEA